MALCRSKKSFSVHNNQQLLRVADCTTQRILLFQEQKQTLMKQASAISNERKVKSDWQLFTNDGKFDSKLPPSQRLLQKWRIYYSNKIDSRLPQRPQSSRKLPAIFILDKADRPQKMASNECFDPSISKEFLSKLFH